MGHRSPDFLGGVLALLGGKVSAHRDRNLSFDAPVAAQLGEALVQRALRHILGEERGGDGPVPRVERPHFPAAERAEHVGEVDCHVIQHRVRLLHVGEQLDLVARERGAGFAGSRQPLRPPVQVWRLHPWRDHRPLPEGESDGSGGSGGPSEACLDRDVEAPSNLIVPDVHGDAAGDDEVTLEEGAAVAAEVVGEPGEAGEGAVEDSCGRVGDDGGGLGGGLRRELQRKVRQPRRPSFPRSHLGADDDEAADASVCLARRHSSEGVREVAGVPGHEVTQAPGVGAGGDELYGRGDAPDGRQHLTFRVLPLARLEGGAHHEGKLALVDVERPAPLPLPAPRYVPEPHILVEEGSAGGLVEVERGPHVTVCCADFPTDQRPQLLLVVLDHPVLHLVRLLHVREERDVLFLDLRAARARIHPQLCHHLQHVLATHVGIAGIV
mmetsp:Transcript_45250/g.107264  ORF Transcript_45250/g.107264 Transcript_45250/m.107264 type:complete len:439 (+) Transcript_45250:1023-2339(+)